MRAESPSAIAVFIAVSLCALGLGAPNVAQAQAQAARVGETRTTASAARPLADAHDDEARAREWGLRAEDWSRYRTLMQGPLGIYSPNLDPLTALGIEARSDEERRRYAELQVQAEARRVQKPWTTSVHTTRHGSGCTPDQQRAWHCRPARRPAAAVPRNRDAWPCS